VGFVPVAALAVLAGPFYGDFKRWKSPESTFTFEDLQGLVGFGFLVAMGVWACIYGINVLRGKAGRTKLLGKVQVYGDDSQDSEANARWHTFESQFSFNVAADVEICRGEASSRKRTA